MDDKSLKSAASFETQNFSDNRATAMLKLIFFFNVMIGQKMLETYM